MKEVVEQLQEVVRLLKLILKQGAVEDQTAKAALAKEGENGS